MEFLFFLFCSAIPCILKHFFHAHNNTKFTAFFPTKKNQNFKHLNIEYIEIFWMMHKILKRENNQILCLAFVFRLLHLPNVKFAYFFNFVRKNYAKWNGMVKWRKKSSWNKWGGKLQKNIKRPMTNNNNWKFAETR